MLRSRRRFLQSSLTAGGLTLPLADVLRLRAAARTTPDTAVIQVWLGGGPSQFETFDPKPDAPVEFRGPYGAISSVLPGLPVCETLPQTSRVLEQASIIRTVSHSTNGHFVGAHWLSTGYPGTSNRSSHPSTGALVSRFRGSVRGGLPPYVLLSEEQTRNPEIGSVMGAAYLGTEHAPFTVKQDPFRSPYQEEKVKLATSNLVLADDVTLERVDDRRTLLRDFDRFSKRAEATQQMAGIDEFQRLALDMVTSGAARNAFDLDQEPQAVRKRYGSHRWGQMGLLARRLVEAGVTFVTLNTAPDSLCWDWHLNIVNDKRPADGSQGPSRGMDISGPPLDQMMTALITDLHERGLDRKVLLLVWGEFGRTPRVNSTGGRDHWGSLMSILMAGGGLKKGVVIGSSNSKGEIPVSRPVHPTEVLATVYRHLGIDYHQHTVNAAGRPVPILPDGQPIAELL